MKVRILVARSAYPIVGAEIDIPESICIKLVDSKLAEYIDTKPKTKTKTKTKTKSKKDKEKGKEPETEG